MKTLFRFCSVLVHAMLLIIIVAAQMNAAENPQLKRKVSPKRIYTTLPENVNADLIVFKFREGTSRPQLDGRSFLRSGPGWDQLNRIISEETKTVTSRPRVMLDPSKLDRMRAEGSRRVGWQLPDMSLYYEIQVKSDLSAHDRLDIINRISALDFIEIAYFSPRLVGHSADVDADVDIAAAQETPNWENRSTI